MYCINVKEQFYVRLILKAPIFIRQEFNMFQAHSVLEGTNHLLIFSDNLLLRNRNWSILTLQKEGNRYIQTK